MQPIPDNSSNHVKKSQQSPRPLDQNVNKSTIEAALMKIGMPVSLKGFAYITDAILLLDSPDWQAQKWTALYYKIALLNNTTASRVEKAIRNAFTITRAQTENYELTAHYIGMTNRENSNSLLFLYKQLKQETCFSQAGISYEELQKLVRETVFSFFS